MFFADEINKNNKLDIDEIAGFLSEFKVKYDFPEKTFVIRDKGKIISTGSVDGNILKYFFTLPEYKGEGTISVIYNVLLKYVFEKGQDSFFVFTSPNNIDIFKSLGLKLVYKTSEVALLEGGFYNYDNWIKKIKKEIEPKKAIRGAIVMNCNPMTLGHLYLIEQALKKVDQLLIFIVEEDRSVFPFKFRYEIMENELKNYKNIELLKSGPYIISNATFPTYFLKEKDKSLDAYTNLDAGIFGEKIGKDLEIDIRFLGTELFDIITNSYNESIKKILKQFDIKVEIIDRKKQDQEIISASKVRHLLSQGEKSKAYKFLPQTTINFLESEKGKEIIGKLKS